MPQSFEPKTQILPKAQQEIWPLLAPAPGLSFVLYGGTAVALYLGHRISVDFDFFRTEPLGKKDIETSFTFMRGAQELSCRKGGLRQEATYRRRWAHLTGRICARPSPPSFSGNAVQRSPQ
jgi:Nucleotidyl transferase AbiEii toxin, Type IV TA system